MKLLNDNQDRFNNCYICGSSKVIDLYPNKSIIKCESCKFAFYKYLPSKKDLDLIYANYSRHSYITQSSHQKLLKTMDEVLLKGNVKSALDIACGECYHLDALRELNPDIDLYATEHKSAKNNVISKGYKFIEGEFYPETDLKFDLIIFTEAIEHINDPLNFLNHANNLLAKNGMIYMTTPCFSSLERKIMKDRWGMIAPPEHLSYFSKLSIEKALKLTGFKKIYSRSLNISIFRIIEFINSKKNKDNSYPNQSNQDNLDAQVYADKAQNIVNKYAIINLFKKIINIFLNLTGLGSSLQTLYKKI